MKDDQNQQDGDSTVQSVEKNTADVLSADDEKKERRREWSTDNLQNLSVF